MRNELHSRVMDRVCGLFDAKIIQNNLRGLYVEIMVAELLGQEWELTGGDWAAWDIEHKEGTRIEVKQASAQQTWTAPQDGSAPPSFGIRTPQYTWKGAKRFAAEGRPAQIYVFAWHDNLSEQCDQRDSEQWEFFVLPSKALPDQKTIGLNPLRQLANPVEAINLFGVVEAIRGDEGLQ